MVVELVLSGRPVFSHLGGMDGSSQQPNPPLLPTTPRSALKRAPKRGSYERAAIDAILDEALVCHLGVTVDPKLSRTAEPYVSVLPTAHVRVGDAVYLHGARANRLLVSAIGTQVCLTVTLLDGLVLSRNAFHHSMNYRSVVLYGVASEVTDAEEKKLALSALVEHVAAGRSAETRAPNDTELAITLIVKVPIEEGAAKTRSGPPIDGPEQEDEAYWAGEIPLKLCGQPPVRDPKMPIERAISPAVLARLQQLGARMPYERRLAAHAELLLSTDVQRIDVALVHRFLSEESYWAKGIALDVVHKQLEGALCFGLYRGATQIGFARVVTDFARIAYLGDVFIVVEERGRGLGSQLVEAVLAHPELASLERWLLGTNDAHKLYERLGFVRAPAGKYMVRPRDGSALSS
jgi:nitroimidazol reductase NimA-like FMN-containing flavoprotein (pyridoxamine 5'-phosphate oxidase superfamily)/GNAT superfamily N-acetyltransferase